jgi:NAD(P)-dependent dehydrogenase (short-subunit alcohol dehydrogenase family)
MEHLADRVAVITGAASGIGEAMAHRFGAAGMHLMLADIEPEGLTAVAATLRGHGCDVSTFVCDVSDADAVDALATATMAAYEAVHLVCNNAGVGAGGAMDAVDLETWSWVLGVNLWGVIHGVRSFLPLLRQAPEAHIVNTASVAGLFSVPFMGPYNVSKFGVVTLSETLYHELADTSVGVSVLCPSWVRTRIHESMRNAPSGVSDTLDAGGLMTELVGGGIDPAEAAEATLDAVVHDRFYILTHPDTTLPALGARHQALTNDGPPPSLFPS